MTIVELYRRNQLTAEAELVARVYAPDPDGPAVIMPADPDDLPAIDAQLADGVAGPDGGRLYLEDGEAYVEALPEAYHGSRFWAEVLR